MRYLKRIFSGSLVVLVSAACIQIVSPTKPSDLGQEVRVAGAAFSVTSVSLHRDFMPVVLDRRMDGGRALSGAVIVQAVNEGGASRFNVTAAIYDAAGKRYPVDVSVLEQGTLSVWDGSVGSGEVKKLELALSGGPSLPVRTEAFVVLEWSAQNGRKGKMRTPAVEIQATY